MFVFLSLIACGPDGMDDPLVPGPPDPPTVDTDVATPIETADTAPPTPDPNELFGQVPDVALPIPSFAATNYDGTSRGPDALQGHLTVLWFLPAANTGG